MENDIRKPSPNPFPRQTVEVEVGMDTVREFDETSLLITYEVGNSDSVPYNPIEGTPVAPSVTRRVPLTRVPGKAWRGRVALDAWRDEDLFGLGVCHWQAVSVTAQFVVHGLTFSVSLLADGLGQEAGEVTGHFSQRAFDDASLNDGNSRLGLAREGRAPAGTFPVRLRAGIMEETTTSA